MRSLIIVIYNPAARTASDKKIARATAFLEEKGFAADALKRKPRLLIAAGGDGTINEVINGIVWTDTPLAVLPLGTTNVLAKELNIPEDLYGALVTAVTSTPKRVSLGVVQAGSGQEPAARSRRQDSL
jgi:diacylglycerol kinase family enzyme